jgi:GTPase KRas protein
LLDTAGQEEFSSLREAYMRGNDGFVIVCSITNSKSFEEVDDFLQQILRVKDVETFPMILVANKCDLENEREVEASSIEAYCKQNKIKHYNSSALKRINIDEPFMELVREIRKFKNKKNVKVESTETKVETNNTTKPEEKSNVKEKKTKKKVCVIL